MLFWKSRAKLEAKIEREKARWQSPKTPSGARIGNAEALVYILVFITVLLLVAVAPKQPMVHLLIFGSAVFALSDAGRRMLIPMVYGLLAAKFGWPNFEDASAEEAEARASEKAAKSAAQPEDGEASASKPTAAPIALAAEVQEIVKTFFSVSRDERRPRIEAVLAFLGRHGVSFPEVEDGETPEDRVVLAETALKRFAKQHGITMGGAQ